MRAIEIINESHEQNADCAALYNALVEAAEEETDEREYRALRAAADAIGDQDELEPVAESAATVAALRAYRAV